MATIYDLPNEILDALVDQVHPDDFEPFALTCKRVYAATEHRRPKYNALKARYGDLARVFTPGFDFGQLLLEIWQNPMIVKYIRTFSFSLLHDPTRLSPPHLTNPILAMFAGVNNSNLLPAQVIQQTRITSSEFEAAMRDHPMIYSGFEDALAASPPLGTNFLTILEVLLAYLLPTLINLRELTLSGPGHYKLYYEPLMEIIKARIISVPATSPTTASTNAPAAAPANVPSTALATVPSTAQPLAPTVAPTVAPPHASMPAPLASLNKITIIDEHSILDFLPFISLPCLQKLCATRVRGERNNLSLWADWIRASSVVEEISLAGVCLAYNEFWRFCAPFKHLRVLRMESSTSDQDSTKSGGLIAALTEHCSTTLQDLHLNIRNHSGTTVVESFRAFSQLKILNINARVLFNIGRRFVVAEDADVPRLVDILPPSLREFRFNACSVIWSNDVDKLFDGFARNQDRLPNLKIVKVISENIYKPPKRIRKQFVLTKVRIEWGCIYRTKDAARHLAGDPAYSEDHFESVDQNSQDEDLLDLWNDDGDEDVGDDVETDQGGDAERSETSDDDPRATTTIRRAVMRIRTLGMSARRALGRRQEIPTTKVETNNERFRRNRGGFVAP